MRDIGRAINGFQAGRDPVGILFNEGKVRSRAASRAFHCFAR